MSNKTEVQKYRNVISQFGIDPDVIKKAATQYDLNSAVHEGLREACRHECDRETLLSKYKQFAANLDYSENSISTTKNMDQTTRTLKNNIIRNTGLAQFHQIRFGTRDHEFDDEEKDRLYDAFADIDFIGINNDLQCAYIDNWSNFLSKNRQNLGWSEPNTRVQMSWNDVNNDLTIGSGRVFTRDVYIDCRFHRPDEISDIFYDAQGFE